MLSLFVFSSSMKELKSEDFCRFLFFYSAMIDWEKKKKSAADLLETG